MTTQRAFPKSLSFNFTHRWSCCHAERCPPIERKLGVEFGLSCLTTQWWTAREHNWSVNLFNFWKKPALPIESHLQTTEKQKKIYFIIKPNNYHSSKPLGSKCFCSSVHESESNRVDCGCDGFRRYNVLSNNFLLKLSKSSLAFKWTTKPPTTFTTPGKGQPDCWSWKSCVSTRSFKKKTTSKYSLWWQDPVCLQTHRRKHELSVSDGNSGEPGPELVPWKLPGFSLCVCFFDKCLS